MAEFLLIHGSGHGAWCWRDVIPALQARGHMACAIDLPGNGNDQTALDQVTLAASAQAVLDASTTGTIIVGHSWGGYPISAAAEQNPGRMQGLIYVCAYVPHSGLSMIDMRKRAPRQTLLDAVQRSPSGDSYTIDEDQVQRLFYHDCPSEAVAFAKSNLCPQATRPQAEQLRTGANFLSVPKAYIRCLQDQTIPPEYQAEMTQDWPSGSVYKMNTSHSPFFANPDGLADLMTGIAEEF
jgi:pimeloyl-ACP methyl ester carboxylesterase